MTSLEMIVGVLGWHGAALVSLRMRLRWRSRREEARTCAVRTRCAPLPPLVQFDEVKPDGGRIRIAVHSVGLERDLEAHHGQR